MNTVLLVNTHNLAEIRAFVAEAAVLQTHKVPGTLAVVYQQKIGAEAIAALVAPLLTRFSAAATVPVPINAGLTDDGRNATLFALFIAQVYARYPGPWLVIDGPGLPNAPNFLTEITKQHKVLGGTCSGRVAQQGASMIPVGPVVLGLPVKKLTWFSPSASEPWRARARYLLGRCGFKVVPLKDYLFDLCSSPALEASLPPVPTTAPAPAAFNPKVLDPQPFKAVEDEEVALRDLMANTPAVASTQAADAVCPDPDTSCPSNPEDVPSCPYEFLSKEDLFTMIELRELPKPHHSTGSAKLIQVLLDDDAARKQALIAIHSPEA